MNENEIAKKLLIELSNQVSSYIYTQQTDLSNKAKDYNRKKLFKILQEVDEFIGRDKTFDSLEEKLNGLEQQFNSILGENND